MELISYALHPDINNKPQQWEPAFARNWATMEGTLEELKASVSAGKAFIPAAMSSGHRNNSAFKYADIAVVDIDHGPTSDQLLEIPLVTAHAAWIYTTPSHDPEQGKHRFRVIFNLPYRIDSGDLYRAAVSLLSRSLGGDPAATDSVRLFYGNTNAQHLLWEPERILPERFIEDARREQSRRALQLTQLDREFDDVTLQRAAYVLEEILPPTNDGERDLFIRVTAAAAGAGEALFSPWVEWASRGHHGTGKNARQASERFFRGFSGRSTPATLFFIADEHCPGWRASLPDELKASGGSPLSKSFPHVVGYAMESYDDFDALEFYEPEEAAPPTASIFEQAPWKAPAPRPAVSVSDSPEDADLAATPSDEPPRRRKKSEIVIVQDILRSHYPGLRLNALNLQLEYGSLEAPRVIDDPSLLYVEIAELSGETFSKGVCHDTALSVGRRNLFNPVKHYLEDAVSRVEPSPLFDRVASEIIGVPPAGSLSNPIMPSGRPYCDEVIRRFLIGAVARVMKPGCRMDWMPVLYGRQSAGKTNFITYLCPPDPRMDGAYTWAPTLAFSLNYLRDRAHALHAGWLVLLDEIDRLFKRANVEDLKNLVSNSTDRSALKFQNERSYPRSFVLAGATNSRSFLQDPTGNRRFLPITVKGVVPSPEDARIKIVNLDLLKEQRDSLWAAAYRAYACGEDHCFSSYELSVASQVAEEHLADTPLEAQIRRVLKANNSGYVKGIRYITLSDLFTWLEIPIDRQNNMLNSATDCLKRLGWTPCRRRINGEVSRIWINGDESAIDEISDALQQVQAVAAGG